MDVDLRKPAKGSGRMARKQRAAKRVSHEDAEKQTARVRDGFRCRWPRCRHRRSTRLEVAHIPAKGMGGDPSGDRSDASKLITLCFFHHQADPQEGHPEGSIERHNLKIEPLTARGMNGPCVFYREIPRKGPGPQEWMEVARECAVGVLDR